MTFKNEKIVKTKSCVKCQINFDITDKDLEFYDKVSPVFEWKKYPIPSPKLCPDCRQQRRLSFRNERFLYKAKCDLTGKEMVSIFSPDKPYTVYDQSVWWSDAWDPMSYGRDFDLEGSFFLQFDELCKQVPKSNLITDFSELVNSPYVNLAWVSKDCHFIFETDRCDRCMYSYTIYDSTDCIDCNNISDSINCYECISIKNGYNLSYCKQCSDCSNCLACVNCISCQNCYGCSNLTGSSYCIFNKQYSQEDYEQRLSTLSAQNDMQHVFSSAIHKSLSGIWNHWEITGDYITHSKNIIESYDVTDSENCKYCSIVSDSKDCMDYTSWWENSSLMYECHNSGASASQLLFCNFVWDSSSSILYSNLCSGNNSYLFGCVGLRSKSYCIFNKQYSRQEYEKLVPKIIEKMIQDWEWWEFFPSSSSLFGYNETVANIYLPLNQQQAQWEWLHWSDYQNPKPNVSKTIPADKLPECIWDIPDDILNWAIECEVTQKPFMVTQQELQFYRRHELSIPRRHPDRRHLDRMALRNPRKLFTRECTKCNTSIQTTYSPERSEKIYCEQCYNREIY